MAHTPHHDLPNDILTVEVRDERGVKLTFHPLQSEQDRNSFRFTVNDVDKEVLALKLPRTPAEIKGEFDCIVEAISLDPWFSMHRLADWYYDYCGDLQEKVWMANGLHWLSNNRRLPRCRQTVKGEHHEWEPLPPNGQLIEAAHYLSQQVFDTLPLVPGYTRECASQFLAVKQAAIALGMYKDGKGAAPRALPRLDNADAVVARALLEMALASRNGENVNLRRFLTAALGWAPERADAALIHMNSVYPAPGVMTQEENGVDEYEEDEE